MTNTEGINYKHPKRARRTATVVAGGPVVLQAGQTIWLTGPKAGRVVVESATADSKISYRKAGR